jgi:hypothetical protein
LCRKRCIVGAVVIGNLGDRFRKEVAVHGSEEAIGEVEEDYEDDKAFATSTETA